MRDGDKYTAWVTACNAAGLCNHSASDEIVIDSSPPRSGGFHKGMTWELQRSQTRLNLLWYGFVDVESDVQTYYIEVSRNYSGSELSNGTVEVSHHNATIQNSSLVLNDKVTANEKIVLTVWAKNGVGLKSDSGKVTVTLVATDSKRQRGMLRIERHSCDSHYCNGDCTCAVVGLKCLSGDKMGNCSEMTNTYSNVRVRLGTPGSPQSITASSKCLSLFWTIDDAVDNILRYEWSMGLSDEEYGAGIFDKLSENTWYDVGKQNYVAHCLPHDRALVHRGSYVGYIRAWYDHNKYKTFTSDPIVVDHTPPTIRRGSSVKESVDGCLSDVDYLNDTHSFNVCWSKVFTEREGCIIKYSLYAGTMPGSK